MTSITTPDSDKKLAFETAFDSGHVMVIVDISNPQVTLPDIARSRSNDGRHLALAYSRTFVEASIQVKNEGLHAGLAFGKPHTRHKTFVPWSAVIAIIQNGMILESWHHQYRDPQEHIDLTVDDLKWFSTTAAEA